MKTIPKFFNNECHKCGVCDEYRFHYAGPHIKAVCNGCGFYVKFIKPQQIPDVKEIKLRIWSMTDQKTEPIETAKQKCAFVPNLKGTDEKLQYWKLYLELRKEFAL